MHKLGVEEWLVRVVSEEFVVHVDVHQRSVLSSLLFITEVPREFRLGCRRELLYADDLVLIAESMDELIEKYRK